jgi:hypothetical protein
MPGYVKLSLYRFGLVYTSLGMFGFGLDWIAIGSDRFA